MSSGCRGLVVSSLIVKTKGRHMYSERRPLHWCRFSYMATPAGLVVARVTPAQLAGVQSHAPPLRNIELRYTVLVGGTTSDAICRETAAADAGAPTGGSSFQTEEFELCGSPLVTWLPPAYFQWLFPLGHGYHNPCLIITVIGGILSPKWFIFTCRKIGLRKNCCELHAVLYCDIV